MGAMHLLSILSAVFLIPHFKPLLFSTSLKDLWWKNGLWKMGLKNKIRNKKGN
jgi:hypothetical protein